MCTTIRRWGGYLICVAIGWIAVLALVMLASDAAPGAIALFPAQDFTSRLPDGAAVVGGGRGWVAIRADLPEIGSALYRAGALLVLPAGLPGCLPLPD